MIEIKNRWTGAVIYRSETATTVREAAIELVKKATESGSYADLRGAVLRDSDLRGAVLRDSDLRGADLSYADLSGAVLRDSDLRDSDLRGAVLRDSDLRDSVLRDSDLRDSDLRGADLSYANLRDSDLSYADLSGAVLSGAVLRDSDLRGAVLSEIRDDVWRVLDVAPNEVAGLLFAVREGRINGSVYFGPCACLVGTIANVRACNVYDLPTEIQPDASRLAERWFLGMKPGDTPAHHPVSLITAEWIEAWMTAHDMPVPRAVSHEQAHAFVRANMANFEAFVAHEKKPKVSEL